MAFTSRLRSVGLVVLATSNNPRLLNEDFLKRNKIVPDEWEVSDVLVTPPFAQIAFKNSVTIQLLENRFNVDIGTPGNLDWVTAVPEIIINFLTILPQVDYRGTGMNFVFTSDKPVEGNAEKHLIDHMLMPGSWTEEFEGLTGAVLELRYRRYQPQINIKIGVKETPSPEEGKIAEYIVSVNVHHDFVREQVEERKVFIRNIGKYLRDAEGVVAQLPLSR